MTDEQHSKAADTDSETSDVFYWRDSRGRVYAGDTEDIARISRLTAVAEHGFEAVVDNDVHHELAASIGGCPVHVNVPEWLVPLERGEHLRLHRDDDWTDDDIPLLREDADAHHESASQSAPVAGD